MMNKRTEGKIKTDYGMSDYYKYYLKTFNSNITKIKFNKIISEFNKLVVYNIIENGLEYSPATLNFNFCIRKNKQKIIIKDNKLINNAPIDWKTTNQLWKEDPDAKDKKLRIRFLNNHTSKYVFRIKALNVPNSYKNKKYYKFTASRFFQRSLSKRIFDDKKENFEAYELY